MFIKKLIFYLMKKNIWTTFSRITHIKMELKLDSVQEEPQSYDDSLGFCQESSNNEQFLTASSEKMKGDDQNSHQDKPNPQKVLLLEGDEILQALIKELGDAPVNHLLLPPECKLNIERRVCSLLLSQILNQEIKAQQTILLFILKHPEDPLSNVPDISEYYEIIDQQNICYLLLMSSSISSSSSYSMSPLEILLQSLKNLVINLESKPYLGDITQLARNFMDIVLEIKSVYEKNSWYLWSAWSKGCVKDSYHHCISDAFLKKFKKRKLSDDIISTNGKVNTIIFPKKRKKPSVEELIQKERKQLKQQFEQGQKQIEHDKKQFEKFLQERKKESISKIEQESESVFALLKKTKMDIKSYGGLSLASITNVTNSFNEKMSSLESEMEEKRVHLKTLFSEVEGQLGSLKTSIDSNLSGKETEIMTRVSTIQKTLVKKTEEIEEFNTCLDNLRDLQETANEMRPKLGGIFSSLAQNFSASVL